MLFLSLAASAYIYVDAYSDCDLFVVLSIFSPIRARYSVKSNEVLILYSNLLMPRHD